MTTEQVPGKRSPGSLSWGGINNTYFWIDPSRGHCGRDLDAVPAVRRRQGLGCLRCVRAGGLSARKRRAITPAGGALAAPMPDKGDFGSSESHETLPGGERVLIRRARPEDVALYRDFLADVSAEDLRLRFFAHVAELSAAEIDKLSHLDYRHEMAFVALDENTGQMLGLVRLKDELDEKTAEFAVLVRSQLKGHGLGWQTRLAARLSHNAQGYRAGKTRLHGCLALVP